MSAKLWIGTIMFYIVATVLCNIVDGSAMITSSNDLAGLSESSITQSQDTTGTPATYVSIGTGFSNRWARLYFSTIHYSVIRMVLLMTLLLYAIC